MSHSNISVFVPHIGCPHRCAFCDQRAITGSGAKIPRARDVQRVCAQVVEQVGDLRETELAFFGGSFTAVPREYMNELLGAAQPFVGEGGFKGIRISTRPDCVDEEILDILKKSGVTSIELGAQSMSDKVLAANERGHTSRDVENASRLIREYGFELGLQMMIGLYRSEISDERLTVERICGIAPDTVRIYPVVILENTRLAELYRSGEYRTFGFETAVELATDALGEFERRGIRVIKCGLHASELVESEAVGGFYHPAFRELCEGLIFRRAFEKEIENARACSGIDVSYAEFRVPQKSLSKALGQKKSNVKYFAGRGVELKVTADPAVSEKYVTVKIG